MDTNDVVVTYFNPNPRDERWGLEKEIGVRMVHTPTGLSTECSLHASRAENRISANFRLHQLLKERGDVSVGSEPDYQYVGAVAAAGPGYAPIVTHGDGTLTIIGAGGAGIPGGNLGVRNVIGSASKSSTFAALPSINFHDIDMEQVKSDLDNNVIICRATLHKVIDIAYQAQKLLGHAKPVASSRATEAEEGPDVSKNKFTYNREQ